MRFNDIKEKTLIEEIKKEFFSSKSGLILGIGDDAAVFKAGRRKFILTKDLLLEGAHFYKDLYPPFLLGRKSLNVNLSDIAAMGGTPLYFLLGLGLPEKIEEAWVEEYFSGLKSACQEFDIALLGGDVSKSEIIAISVTVIGEGRNIIKRSGARPDDLIYVSGKLGDSFQGLQLLKTGTRVGQDQEKDVLLNAFFDPVPQVELGKRISNEKIASSMIDVSDGLSVDLNHICEESGVGAEIYAQQIPISDELKLFQGKEMEASLHGGEDYSLLFTVPQDKKDKVNSLRKEHEISEIGKVVKEKGLFLIDKNRNRKRLDVKGWQHFSAV